MRSRDRPKPTTSWWFLILLVIAALVFGWYVLFTARGIELSYDETTALESATLAKQMKKIETGNKKAIYLTGLDMLSANRSWMYVTKTTPLPNAYKPADLTKLSTPTGASDSPMQLRRDVSMQLEKLFAFAQTEDYDLMVSSAYRSIDEQTRLFEEMKTERGSAYAEQYVLTPGASEHHTGYAVDITDASSACKKDADQCILSPATAAWLADNAPGYGFIIRYPSGKESLTGISHEPWHLRYVGVVLATQLSENDLTLDEFIEQIAPGRVK